MSNSIESAVGLLSGLGLAFIIGPIFIILIMEYGFLATILIVVLFILISFAINTVL